MTVRTAREDTPTNTGAALMSMAELKLGFRSQVKSDSEENGSSTTTPGETSVDKLFSGEPKYVNVHEAGIGNPPILSCADLKRAG